MTQAELGAELGVDSNHVSRIERGKVRPPAKARAILVRVLRRPMEYFVDEPLDELVREPLARYPNAVIAAEFARREGVAESAITWVLSGQHNLSEDAQPADWLRAMERREREERRSNDLAPPQGAAERARNEAVMDEREKEATPALPRRR